MAIRRAAGVERDAVVTVLDLADSLGVGVGFYPQHLLRGLDARIFWPRGRGAPPEIALRRGLTPRRRTWCIAHELAEHQLALGGYVREDIEAMANATAAALLMPRAPFREAAVEHRMDLGALAADFACDETAAALRLGETGVVQAIAVVCPSHIYARASNEAFVFPSANELRREARSGSPTLGLSKMVLTDVPRRVALVIDLAA